MHFHRAIIDAFAAVFGRRALRILKPSPQHERFLGFDQGWLPTCTLTDAQLRAELTRSIEQGESLLSGRFLGYFLQFKTVTKCKNKTKFTPRGGFRSELDLRIPKKGHWQWSQHTTLLRLQVALGAAAEVSYVCPMVFEPYELFEEPDLDRLRIVPVQGAPPKDDGDRHFVYFAKTDAQPEWRSEPVPGRSLSFEEWLRRQHLLTAAELSKLLDIQASVMEEGLSYAARFRRWTTANQLTIIEFGPPEERFDDNNRIPVAGSG